MKYLIGLLLFLTMITAQVTDKNFKDSIGKGFVVVVFTSDWQKKELDSLILNGIDGHEDAKVITVKSEEVKKIAKKLRIRNYPSIALFHGGSKKEVWKADMDGEVDCSANDIKKAISNVSAGDVF
jgi:uncharacterized protein YpuA (DUF1002 family)